MNLIILFAVLSIVNVIFATVRSLVTVKGGKCVASIVNALYWSYYNIVLIYTVADFDMWVKCLITFSANLFGVYIVKLVEEKMTKDKLWVFGATVKHNEESLKEIVEKLKSFGIKCVYTEVIENELYTMQIFSNTQKESAMIKGILDNYNIKYFAMETKAV